MKLKSINISNYRSIENLTFAIETINGSQTFTLIGVNESGKSSFLKALDLFDNSSISYPLDFYDDTKPVTVTLNYLIDTNDLKDLKEHLAEEFQFDKSLLHRILINEVLIEASYEPTVNVSKQKREIITFKEAVLSDYTL